MAALSYCKSIFMETRPAMPSSVPPAGLSLRSVLRTQGEVRRIAWSPDGRWLAVPSADRVLRLWEGEGSGAVRVVSEGVAPWSVAWSPDGRILAAGMVLREAVLWDVESAAPARRLDHPRGAPAVLFAPDGRTLITGGDDHLLRIWDLGTGAPRGRLSGHSKGVTGLAWQPQGAYLASSSLDRTVRLWDVTAEREALTLRGHQGGVLDLAWSPDGRFLVSASSDSVLRVWHPERGAEIGRLEGHGGAVTGVCFSPDGRLLISKSLDGTVRFWSTAGWRPVAVLDEPSAERNPAGTVVFHPHRPLLVTLGDGDTSVRLWDVEMEALFAPPVASPLEREANLSDTEEIRARLDRKRETEDFDVFLCHHSEDKPMVKVIGRALQSLGLLPWLDEWEVAPGRSWQKAMDREISRVRAVAVFVGPRGIGPWQDQEVMAFIRQLVKRECPVIPVILPGSDTRPELPPLLEGLHWVDFRRTKPHPLEHLVWGITNRRLRADDPMARQIARIAQNLLTEIQAAGDLPQTP